VTNQFSNLNDDSLQSALVKEFKKYVNKQRGAADDDDEEEETPTPNKKPYDFSVWMQVL
jgi:hypothetical protein